ncbi:type VI secretion system protein ImpB [Luteibacter rhizovicinus]|uniref:Type VI secretion system protein ImpB n=1 Tax=Luteibacter rhizovicinus TaxID=242606 RepID=A0A4R3YVX9_9GAMM|nr:type VI secretion system contractile sheath small subunit [Luteibacter rhizovicinus]TCV97295.1 type VI secretion system protein ImpB [Luteibacter rhizovicinus]
MSRTESSQKFIARNRPPRVQIEYDVELNGAEAVVELPFVTGVIGDLAGAPRGDALPLAERKFLDIDMDNFDERLRSIHPAVNLRVPNELAGEGELAVSFDIQCMDDFSPGAIARHVEPLRQLLEAREQLANLLAYMDGKAGAEELVATLLGRPELMKSLLP